MLMGTSPSALCAPLPSLGVSGAVAMFSPWGGPLAPSPGNSVPGTLPHLFLPDPVGHPPTLVSPAQWPFWPDWIVNSETQCHIVFINHSIHLHLK